jgi:hypothetical protein
MREYPSTARPWGRTHWIASTDLPRILITSSWHGPPRDMKDETFEVLWKNVVDCWDDDAAHQVFLRHCQAKERLGDAAGRYVALKNDEVRGASARRHLEMVATLAAASLTTSRKPSGARFPRWLVVLTALSFGSLAAYALVRALLL